MHRTFDSQEERKVFEKEEKQLREVGQKVDISEHSRLMDKLFVSISKHFLGVISLHYVKQCSKDSL